MTNSSYISSQKKSENILTSINEGNCSYIAISGDRPTGALHIGHYFGVLKNRIFLQNKGVKLYVLIADYQFYTDRKLVNVKDIKENVQEVLLDYFSTGLNPNMNNVILFNHSKIPELNQLIIPFLSLVTLPELMRNPTVKEESKFSSEEMTGAMLTYPIHQAADILFCKSNIVPVGKDQLAHLEITRKIARRFNKCYGNTFPIPECLLSETPVILGMDGCSKMSKSRKNAIYIKSTEDETFNLIMGAKTDSLSYVSYDTEKRPEISNLFQIYQLCTNEDMYKIEDSFRNKGTEYFKKKVVEAVNEFFYPIRKKRIQLKNDMEYLLEILDKGNLQARNIAINTLNEVCERMGIGNFHG